MPQELACRGYAFLHLAYGSLHQRQPGLGGDNELAALTGTQVARVQNLFAEAFNGPDASAFEVQRKIIEPSLLAERQSGGEVNDRIAALTRLSWTWAA